MARTKIAFKVDIEADILEAFRSALDKQKIGYSLACEELFRWFTSQDPMLRCLLLGQIDPEYTDQVARMVLARIGADPAKTAGAKGEDRKRGGGVGDG